MKKLTILGATGSIGKSTLDVVSRHPERFSVFALTASTNVETLLSQILQFKPRYAVMVDSQAAGLLREKLALTTSSTEVLSGAQALCDVAADSEVDIVMAAIVGASGLMPTLTAVEAGKTVLLANKESLVMSGQLFMQAVSENGATLFPIDSEHNAIFQCLPLDLQQSLVKGKMSLSKSSANHLDDFGIRKILLTGSGGPFLNTPLSDLPAITPAQAVKHPNWSMGQKISVDSATMMNKGLEFIEACYLFALQPKDIQVVVHPQSVIHSMVQYRDGSVLAQLGQPDMRTPIAHALGFPERLVAGVEPLDFSQLTDFSFTRPDFERYPNLQLAIEAFDEGQGATTVLNAANEESVAAFLADKIRFTDIAKFNAMTLDKMSISNPTDIDSILALDGEARVLVKQLMKQEEA
jgi:1-deoxy-D-xylulose-5-phosphate reductoisomerase